MTVYLNTYRPLICTRVGRIAAGKYGLALFIDSSCRREPDFQSEFPSISALCRFYKFAPRLREDDIVVYLTVKKKYFDASEAHWRLPAILQVLKRFESHKDAAAWYREQSLSLPSNCMVEGNGPVPLDRTSATHDSVEEWDRVYRFRAIKCPVFLACTPVHLNLYDPPIVTKRMMLDVFARFPATQNPPAIADQEYYQLRNLVGPNG